eukprot:1132981-Pelagomonas_calceolata.AAC.2
MLGALVMEYVLDEEVHSCLIRTEECSDKSGARVLWHGMLWCKHRGTPLMSALHRSASAAS